jgi:enoyl-CoA hydratase
MLDIEDRSGVVVVRLDHGEVNALDSELPAAITAAAREIDRTTVTVLTGTGSAFSAGADLRRPVDGGQSYVEAFLTALTRMFLAVFVRPAPVVAAVDGHAIAGGCVLAAACDVRIMATGKIGLSELRVDAPFPLAAMEIMRHVVGGNLGKLVNGAADEARRMSGIRSRPSPSPKRSCTDRSTTGWSRRPAMTRTSGESGPRPRPTGRSAPTSILFRRPAASTP